jgi:hypothetical protein
VSKYWLDSWKTLQENHAYTFIRCVYNKNDYSILFIQTIIDIDLSKLQTWQALGAKTTFLVVDLKK